MFYRSVKRSIRKMNEKTKAFAIIAIVVVTGIALVTAYSLVPNSVLAKSKSKSTSSSASSSSSSSSTSSSTKLKHLVSCVTTSAKAATGGLSQNQVLSCYSQAYGNATGITNSTSPTIGTGGNTSSTNGGSSSSSGTGSTHKSSSSSHHHSSGSSTK